MYFQDILFIFDSFITEMLAAKYIIFKYTFGLQIYTSKHLIMLYYAMLVSQT